MRKSVQGRISERTGEERQSTDVLNMVHELGGDIIIVAVGGIVQLFEIALKRSVHLDITARSARNEV